jgi:HlyD family secretion protein
MKKLFILFIPLIVILQSCSNDDGKSDAYGNFEATETIVSVNSEGKILSLNLEEGETLPAGKIIGFIDTTQLHLRKMQLIEQKRAISTKSSGVFANVNVIQQKIESNLVEKRRIENLLKSEATPERNLDDVNANINVLQKEIAATRTQNKTIFAEMETVDAQIKQIEDLIDKSIIVNPVDGTVLVKFVEQWETNTPGKPLYKIANLDEIILRVYISGAQLPSISVGQKVTVIVDQNADSDRRLEGEISWISSKAEFTPKIIQTKEERVNLVYAVKVRVKNDGTLKIGMPGEIVFDVNSANN